MKRHLQITIDANRVTCGKCDRMFDYNDGSAVCTVFGTRIDLVQLSNRSAYRRCAPCLAAEREAT